MAALKRPVGGFLLGDVGYVDKKDAVEVFVAGQLRRQLEDVVGGADEEDIAFMMDSQVKSAPKSRVETPPSPGLPTPARLFDLVHKE